MSSGIFEPGTFCCICFEGFDKVGHFVDADGNKWDIHNKAECAVQAFSKEELGDKFSKEKDKYDEYHRLRRLKHTK